MIQTEVERRVKEIVDTRVREELERRKDEIENEVKRRVDVLKRTMEKQMLLELEKRNTEELKRLVGKEVDQPVNTTMRHVVLLGRGTKEA